ncbi:hypothetical protein AK812_SmicGene27084 [Symbiodinium microadriaticum]|uniref:Uncharacterized protein n=1 Tax=Symbiodinium microadriaticum TaxID=2951 RepID=A0A1Q9D7R7_SYMMI|nr:hypothetical protein AK812_SmicGene27084 [Symbiodinium microadriaticum]
MRTGITSTELMIRTNAVGSLAGVAGIVLSRDVMSMVAYAGQQPELWWLIPSIGLSLAGSVLCYTDLVAHAGSVAAVGVATLRKSASLLLSYFLFPGKPFSTLSGLGLLVLTLGLLLAERRATSRSRAQGGNGNERNEKEHTALAGSWGQSKVLELKRAGQANAVEAWADEDSASQDGAVWKVEKKVRADSLGDADIQFNIDLLVNEMQFMDALQHPPEGAGATTLLVAPRCEKLLDFEVQMAAFHPDFRFNGSDAADCANFVGRAPYPAFHLLREEAILGLFETSSIFQYGLQTLTFKGTAKAVADGTLQAAILGLFEADFDFQESSVKVLVEDVEFDM